MERLYNNINNGMCRCCASEGTFKDLSSKYRWMGVEEVYADMLRECFDVTLTYPEENPEAGICEVCITQLRNAANFKKQVLNTEEQFKKMLQNKTNIVKVEVSPPEDDGVQFTDEDNNLSNDDFSSTEYEVPIKTESEEGKSRKRSAKAGPSRSKQPKMEGESSAKRNATETFQKNDNDLQVIEEDILDRKNINLNYAVIMLQGSTLLPFATSPGYKCFYCNKSFKEIEILNAHTIESHDDPDVEEIRNGMVSRKKKMPFISVNVVNLKCKKCDDPIKNLMDLESHLIEKHGEPLPDTDDPVLIPFKIGNGMCICAWCGDMFGGYNTLSNHMNVHYPIYKCDMCDAGFLTADRLKFHKAGHARRIQNITKKSNIIANEEPTAGEGEIDTKINDVRSETVTNDDIDEYSDENQTLANNPRKSAVRKTKKLQSKRKILSSDRTPLSITMKIRETTVKNAVILIQNSTVLPFKYSSGYKCIYCNVAYGDIEKLQEHDNAQHVNPSEKRIKLAYTFYKRSGILKVNVVNLGCKLCDDVIKDFEELKMHLCIKHGKDIDLENVGVVPFKIANGIFECAICGEEQTGCNGLSYHMNKHYNNYICEQCGAGFMTEGRLATHSQSHSSHSYACDLCRKKFKSVNSLRIHKRVVHERLKGAKCPYCKECFHDYYARQKHIATAHRESNANTMYQCDFCSYSCVVSSQIRTHIRKVHKKEKPYSCSECDKKFYFLGKMEEHVMGVHIGVSFECDYCPKSYSNKKQLRKHVKFSHAGSKFKCEHCDRSFVLKEGLEAHMLQNHTSLLTLSASAPM